MGQVQQKSRGDRRREAIISVAREIFLAEGYGASSMSAIAAAVGGSKGTLYTYFRSKAELFSEVLAQSSEDTPADDLLSADPTGNLAQILTGFGEWIVTMICRPQTLALYRVVISEAGRFPELGEAFYEAGPKAKIEALTGLMARAMASGQLRRCDPNIAAHHFASLCKSRLHQNLLWGIAAAPTPEEVSQEVRHAVQVFMDAYDPSRPALI